MDRKDATPGFEDPLSAEGMMVEKPVQRISVMDHHAFAEKYLADLGQEEADFQVCHWPIQSWHALDKRITCLLYTSPSPRDKRQSRMPSSA